MRHPSFKWLGFTLHLVMFVVIDVIAIPWWTDVRIDISMSSLANNGFFEDTLTGGIPTWAFIYMSSSFFCCAGLTFASMFIWRCEDEPYIVEKYGDHSDDFKKGGTGPVTIGNFGDPLNPTHPSGKMYLRWDPNDESTITIAAAKQKWEELTEKYSSLPPCDAAGVPQQQKLMSEFDMEDHEWEKSPNVAPRKGSQISAERVTAMLRAGGHLTATQSVSAVSVKALAVQGVLSQTFRVEATYSGATKCPATFIAKFLNPNPSFAILRWLLGSGGGRSFMIEDFMYQIRVFGKVGVRQPVCYFTSYDPLRETFCLLMEDLNTADGGYTGGDQLSGGRTSSSTLR